MAGATSDRNQILTAGIAATVAGALSMAGGEYVSVSTQRDTEEAAIARETEELRTMPAEELQELATYYESRGVSPETAMNLATELTAADALRAHTEMEFNLTPGELTSPWGSRGYRIAAGICGRGGDPGSCHRGHAGIDSGSGHVRWRWCWHWLSPAGSVRILEMHRGPRP